MNKKGFTLIELLAIIVILAVIALIGTPIVTNIINTTRKNAAERTCDSVVKEMNNVYGLVTLEDQDVETVTVTFNGSTVTTQKKLASKTDLEAVTGDSVFAMSQTKPTSGVISISRTTGGSNATWGDLTVNGYTCKYDTTAARYKCS